MLNNSPEIEIIPLEELEDAPVKRRRPWKIYFLSAFAVLAVIIVNVCPPLKNSLYELGVSIHSLGWGGPLLFLLFNGLIVIPLALPYLVFEMTIAFLISNFAYAVCFSLAGKLIGGGVSYVLTKYLFRQRIRDSFKGLKIFSCIECVMEKNPLKFSLILRIIMIPLFLKNYGLAIPNSVNFKLYMLCCFVTSVPVTILNIYLFRQAGNLSSLFDGSQSSLEIALSLGMFVLSLFLIVYLVRYTKRFLRQLEAINQNNQNKGNEKDLEMGQAPKIASNIEIKSNGALASGQISGMIELPEEIDPAENQENK